MKKLQAHLMINREFMVLFIQMMVNKYYSGEI